MIQNVIMLEANIKVEACTFVFRAGKYRKLLGFIIKFIYFARAKLTEFYLLLFWEGGVKCPVESRCIFSTFKC